MFNVTVDDKAVSVKEGSTILDAAHAAGVFYSYALLDERPE